jgi:hypothetical protein
MSQCSLTIFAFIFKQHAKEYLDSEVHKNPYVRFSNKIMGGMIKHLADGYFMETEW